MSTNVATSGQRPCWVIIDEAHSLKRLPALETALVEGRKYQIKIVIGTQNKTQIEQSYERITATMLASHTKTFGRINEAESARWVSDMIGQQEIERPRVSTTATVQTHGRDSLNYAPGIKHNSVVSKEQIMALPNLHFYWKYGDAVVPFRIEPIQRPKLAHAFVPRQSRSAPDLNCRNNYQQQSPCSPKKTITMVSTPMRSRSLPIRQTISTPGSEIAP